ncbi:MAG: asparagine synthase (glutamine-hydrolyzing) [Candidatus Eisenbacteria sp.]|nr:asparagine synthase (glutamine-hydrolyzing) [Candidatus Eisenbacteria bacterium]
MCGIAGIISLVQGPPDEELLGKMRDRLAHRGPDDEGRFAGQHAALGHRRLSILDLEHGSQPMTSTSGASVLVHNGEIYNSPELRAELRSLGQRFRGHSDTEVILEGLERHGSSFLNRLNGIFAFAWHQPSTRRTLLARDPFGVKPLYYHRSETRLLFASEIRALLADPSIRAELDPDELGVLLTLRYSPSPGTLLKGIYKLPPGHLIEIEGDRVCVRRFDCEVPQKVPQQAFEEWVGIYAGELGRAVKRQLLSDVPVGLFLSGGADSTGLAALMVQETPEFSTYTVGFEETAAGPHAFDERAAARESAATFGLANEAEILSPDAFSEALPEVVRAMEEPIGSASAVPYWFLARRAARSHKVVLAGQGADEPHGGYARYQGAILAAAVGRIFPAAAGRFLSSLAPGRSERLRRGLSILGQSDPGRLLLETYRHFPAPLLESLIRSPWRGSPARAAERIALWRDPVDHLDPVAQMLYVDSRMWLPDDLLLYGDKLSMAHGLEVRVPYLDRDLMRLVESIPRSFRVAHRRPKRLHRAALGRIVPRRLLSRPKLGFDTPVDHWFRTLWVPRLPDWLWGNESFLPSIMHVEVLKRIFEEHRSGRRDHNRRLYTLLALEFWGRAFL